MNTSNLPKITDTTKVIPIEKVKLTDVEKERLIKPLKDKLGELSSGKDNYEKQQLRRKLLEDWKKIKNDIPLDIPYSDIV